MDAVEIIKLYGVYFIGDPAADYYLMVDTPNEKVRLIDADCYQIIAELSELKKELKNLY